MSFDARITPARPDLAAASLKGRIEAARYVEGREAEVVRGTLDLRKRPAADAPVESQLLRGERFVLYEEKQGWAWGQALGDGYVGYARAEFLTLDCAPVTHRVTVLSTPLLPLADVKTASRDFLPLNACVAVGTEEGRFAKLADGTYVFADHLGPIAETAPDWVATAERFLGVPYLWGGKTSAGIDCSGLIQTALAASGIDAPRDTDMMEISLGTALPLSPEGLARGDLVFWKGHIGVMQDATNLLHANAYFMQTTSETLRSAAERIGDPIRAIKRL